MKGRTPRGRTPDSARTPRCAENVGPATRIGREVAAWIDQGAPDVDIFSFDCARYHPDTVLTRFRNENSKRFLRPYD